MCLPLFYSLFLSYSMFLSTQHWKTGISLWTKIHFIWIFQEKLVTIFLVFGAVIMQQTGFSMRSWVRVVTLADGSILTPPNSLYTNHNKSSLLEGPVSHTMWLRLVDRNWRFSVFLISSSFFLLTIPTCIITWLRRDLCAAAVVSVVKEEKKEKKS